MTEKLYSAPALDKGLDILELLSTERLGLSMSDIAKALGRTRNEIYRMVLALEQRGYVARKGDTDLFMVTNRLFELGMRNPPMADLHAAALPLMYDLSDQLLQSSQLAVASRDQIVVVARVESPGDIGFSVRLGHHRSIVQSASGVVLYAFSDTDHRNRLLKDVDIDADKAAFDRFQTRATEAESRGFVQIPSRIVEGVIDIAAPIFGDNLSAPVASLTVPFVNSLRTRVPLSDAPALIADMAERISAKLQHH